MINLEPLGPGGGYEFVDKIVGGVIPKEYIPAVDAGIQEAMTARACSPATRSWTCAVSSSTARTTTSTAPRWRFKIAGSMAVKEASAGRKPVLLEPIMAVEVVDPGGLHGRRDRRPLRRGAAGSRGWSQRGNAQVIKALVPLAEMFGYATDLRSLYPGPRHVHDAVPPYEEVPDAIAKEIVARATGA